MSERAAKYLARLHAGKEMDLQRGTGVSVLLARDIAQAAGCIDDPVSHDLTMAFGTGDEKSMIRAHQAAQVAVTAEIDDKVLREIGARHVAAMLVSECCMSSDARNLTSELRATKLGMSRATWFRRVSRSYSALLAKLQTKLDGGLAIVDRQLRHSEEGDTEQK